MSATAPAPISPLTAARETLRRLKQTTLTNDQWDLAVELGRALAQVSESPTPISLAALTGTCPRCDLPSAAQHLTCGSCWTLIPPNLKGRWLGALGRLLQRSQAVLAIRAWAEKEGNPLRRSAAERTGSTP